MNELDGGSSTTSFDMVQQLSLSDMVQGQGQATMMCSYDETALCSMAFRSVLMWFQGIQILKSMFNIFKEN